MLNRSSFLALAAITALGVAALAPTNASAFGGRGGGHISGGNGGGGHVSFGHGRAIAGSLSIRRPIRIVTPNHPPHWNWHWRHHGYYGVPVAVGASAVYAAAPRVPAASCTCLTKEYLPDGSLLFKDVCTNEAAMSVPNAQQAEAPMPQAR